MGASISGPSPSPRWGHCSATLEGKFYVWGGRTKNFSKDLKALETCIFSFDLFFESWSHTKCTGIPPPGVYDGSCASAGHYIYVYGGYDGTRGYSNLHQLDTQSWKWKQLSEAGPMKKTGSGMVAYNGKLVLFGGFGVPSGPTQPGSEYIQDSTGLRGWTNEVHMYDPKEGKWTSPAFTWSRLPPACSHFTFTMVDDHRAMLFGGSLPPGPGVTNDLYILDLAKMHWSRLESQPGEPRPLGRSVHAAVCVGYGWGHPQLFVTGGLGSSNQVLNDVWMLDIESGKWKEITIPGLPPRCNHAVSAFNLSSEHSEVTIFGGCSELPSVAESEHGLPQISNTNVLQFEFQECHGRETPTKEWVLTSIADNSQLGAKRRVEAKMSMVQTSHDRSHGFPTGPPGKGKRVKGSDLKASKVTASKESKTSVNAIMNPVDEVQPQWAVDMEEIQMTDQELGTGDVASVFVANFRGAPVAAKFFHGKYLSEENTKVFKEEMNVLDRIRHPNLVQFIGGSVNNMIILMELMPTSLWIELDNQPMAPTKATQISLDVLTALNYLHSMQPRPLIHFNISSTNVFLQKQPDDSWRAKVGDYGIARIYQHVRTGFPGNNPAYAPPETKPSPMMDIYSFGILLMEMLTGRLPSCDERPKALLKSIHQPLLLNVITKCLLEKGEDRPSASDVISRLFDP